jgi:membrane protease YdiL (CAAX protease family)
VIGAIGPADVPSLVLALTGVVPLVVLVRRHRAGRPLLAPADRPFRPVKAEVPLLVAGALFVVYALGAPHATSGRLGPRGTAAAVAALLVAGACGGLFSRRVVLAPRGTFAWRVRMGLLVFWAVLPLVFGTFLLGRLLGPEQPQMEVLRNRTGGWPWLAVTAVLVAPVVEEVCFRGLLYPALRQRFRAGTAIVLSSLAFAAFHLPPTVWLPLAVFAAALAWLVEATGSVVPSIAAHMALNGLTVATVLLGG